MLTWHDQPDPSPVTSTLQPGRKGCPIHIALDRLVWMQTLSHINADPSPTVAARALVRQQHLLYFPLHTGTHVHRNDQHLPISCLTSSIPEQVEF